MNLQKEIVIIFITLSLNLKAQNINEFYFETNTAHKLAKDGKIDSAITTYENAFKKIDYVNSTYLNKVLKLGLPSKNVTTFLKPLLYILIDNSGLFAIR